MLVAEVIFMKNVNKKNSIKDILKTKGFYISLMTGAICTVALVAVCFNTLGINNPNENEQSQIYEKLAELPNNASDKNTDYEGVPDSGSNGKLDDGIISGYEQDGSMPPFALQPEGEAIGDASTEQTGNKNSSEGAATEKSSSEQTENETPSEGAIPGDSSTEQTENGTPSEGAIPGDTSTEQTENGTPSEGAIPGDTSTEQTENGNSSEGASKGNSVTKNAEKGTVSKGANSGVTSKKNNTTEKTNTKVAVMQAGDGVNNLSFDQEKGLLWPVQGDIIMQYSPEKSVYFKTLGVYKTNPALIIAAKTGTNVRSGADAVITEVGENEEIGKYVETAIGNGYKIVYGQLDSIQVKKGAEIKEGEFIGTIAEPTKYFVEEGSNLYLKMTCENETADPMIFLR